MSGYISDFTDYDRKRREDMVASSERLLAALCREHPHIIARLQQQQRDKRNK